MEQLVEDFFYDLRHEMGGEEKQSKLCKGSMKRNLKFFKNLFRTNKEENLPRMNVNFCVNYHAATVFHFQLSLLFHVRYEDKKMKIQAHLVDVGWNEKLIKNENNSF